MTRLYKMMTFSVLMGIVLGFLIGVSIKYPLTVETFDIAQKTCENHGKWKKLRIQINGKVYSVSCNDSTEFKIN